MPLTTVFNVNNYSTIALNPVIRSGNVDLGLRTTVLKLDIVQDIVTLKKH